MMRRLSALDPIRGLGTYYMVTGIWPLIHLRSFMAITGPKQDTWLVQTFGLLIAAIGGTLLIPRRPEERAALNRVAIATGVSLAASEVAFVVRRRISPVYLLDAVVELAAATLIASGHSSTTPANGARTS
jgi:hypothetical protein